MLGIGSDRVSQVSDFCREWLGLMGVCIFWDFWGVIGLRIYLVAHVL